MFGSKIPVIVTCAVLALGLVACAVPIPPESPTSAPPTAAPTATPEVLTVVVTRMVTPTPEPTPMPEPTPVVVTKVVVATNTPVPPTETPRPRPRAVPTSAGPLDFTHWLGGWSRVSSNKDEYEYLIHVEVTGGSPPYVYHHDLETFNTPDILWRGHGCTALVHAIQVDSADGQSVRHDYWYAAPWCPTPEP